jgi:hypothetical protein
MCAPVEGFRALGLMAYCSALVMRCTSWPRPVRRPQCSRSARDGSHRPPPTARPAHRAAAAARGGTRRSPRAPCAPVRRGAAHAEGGVARHMRRASARASHAAHRLARSPDAFARVKCFRDPSPPSEAAEQSGGSSGARSAAPRPPRASRRRPAQAHLCSLGDARSLRTARHGRLRRRCAASTSQRGGRRSKGSALARSSGLARRAKNRRGEVLRRGRGRPRRGRLVGRVRPLLASRRQRRWEAVRRVAPVGDGGGGGGRAGEERGEQLGYLHGGQGRSRDYSYGCIMRV